jgi:3-phosphoshikimate 1-carboxyvinyltransferase
MVLRLESEIVGKEYIQMNRALMEAFGASVHISEDLREIRIERGGYVAHTLSVGPDVTSLFCFIAAAVIVDTDIQIEGVSLGTDSLLDEAVAIGRTLGVQIYQTTSGVRILSGPLPTSLVEFHVAHVPTLVPALTAIAGYLPHGMRLTGAQHIRFHKTSRLETLMTELEKLGFFFQPIYKGDVVDGFEASLGTGRPVCVEPLDSHGDHRLFMALFLACLPLAEPASIGGMETLVASFPEFVARFRSLDASDTYLQISSTTNVRE